MNGKSEPVPAGPIDPMPPTHNRILVIMAVLGVLAAGAGAVFQSISWGIGILFGIVLAFANYYWLRYSLRKVFEAAASDGERPKISAIRYILRYLTLAAIVALIFAMDILPVVPVILGMAGFGFAVVVDGIIRIFSNAEART